MAKNVNKKQPNKRYTVSEVLDLLEDCGDYESADVYIEPPDVNALTDEDSGDENEAVQATSQAVSSEQGLL
ncbi:hypothetical protein RRG08_063120 [Elysia crispata]|uniref:Uncharacterized protein n=1 Tax=Elysia crispata TaxID=231223 RepID=A0AAE0XVJ8_9GAST|nr:hypothetical protein RRG08_063120 [Elysia crispata]